MVATVMPGDTVKWMVRISRGLLEQISADTQRLIVVRDEPYISYWLNDGTIVLLLATSVSAHPMMFSLLARNAD
jgi:hypothetical protein